MQSNWSWVIASYVLTTVALVGYTLYLRGRVRDAELSLRQQAGESE
ncbi:MAG TPA: hypothetical protein VEA99_02975 [Gemmatimonadaceae bacterium]|nr:hypothetical protein [Gemmatimonadaceae bacterium]